MVWSEIVWFQIMNLMVWGGSGVGQSAFVKFQGHMGQKIADFGSN